MTPTPSNELDELDHLCNLCACLPPHDSAYSSKAQKEAILAWHQKKLDEGEHCEMAARINKSSGSSPETGGFIIAEDEFDTYISYPFPLSSGETARLYLPPSITRKDVARIIKMVEALTFEETPLRSNGERRQTNDQL